MKTLSKLIQIVTLGLFLPVLAYAGFSGGGGGGGGSTPIATTSSVGTVQPDGVTALITASGVLSTPIIPISGTPAIGNVASVITTSPLAMQWGTAGMTYPGAGIANSTGSAWGTSYTAGSGASNVPVLDASGNLALNNWTLNFAAGSGTYPTTFGCTGSGTTTNAGLCFGVSSSGNGAIWATANGGNTSSNTVFSSNNAGTTINSTTNTAMATANIARLSVTLTQVLNHNGVWQGFTLPTVTTTNCGGVAIASLTATGTHSINIVIGTSPTTSTCVINMSSTATHGWVCGGHLITAGYATHSFEIARSGVLSTTTLTLAKYNTTTGAAANFSTSDELDLSCGGV